MVYAGWNLVAGVLSLPGDLAMAGQLLGVEWGELSTYRKVGLVISLLLTMGSWAYIAWLHSRPSLEELLKEASPADYRLFLYTQRTEAHCRKLTKRQKWEQLARFVDRQVNLEVPQMLERLYGKAERTKFTNAMMEVSEHAQSPAQVFVSMNRYLLDLFAVRGQKAQILAPAKA